MSGAKKPNADGAHEPARDHDEERGSKSPIASWAYPGSPGSRVEAAVWENTFTDDDRNERVGLAVSFSRSYRKGSGDYARTFSYRLQDLFVLRELTTRAIGYLLDNRTG